MIKLSIIIPHYNDSKRLQRLLNSIPTEKEIEILVIDDNSDTAEQNKAEDIAVKYSETSYFFVNPNKESHSAGACRNIGLEHATGEWVLFADADDYFSEGMYELVSKYFNSENDMVFFGTDSFLEATGEKSTRHKSFFSRVTAYCNNPGRKEELALRSTVNPIAKLIRRSLIESNRIRYEEIRYSNDVMFSTWTGIKAGKIGADESVLYIISDGGGSLTKKRGFEVFDTRKRAEIRRLIAWYQNVDKEDIKLLGMGRFGLRYVLSPIKNKYGLRIALEYKKMLKDAGVPLIVF